MNWTGLTLGLFAMLVIGLGFVWVIRFEYYVGAYRWRWVAAFGAAIIVISLFMPVFLVSAILGIAGGSIVWGALELPHQEERASHGLFKVHPERASRPRARHDQHALTSRPGPGKWWSF